MAWRISKNIARVIEYETQTLILGSVREISLKRT